MLQALVLDLTSDGSNEQICVEGHQAHGLFLNLIQSADPGLSEGLHDKNARKPYTVSGVDVSAGAKGRVQVAARLRITLLDDQLIEPLLRRIGTNMSVRLGSCTLRIDRMLWRGDQSPLAGHTDFDEILARAPLSPEILLHFATPTAFSLGTLPDGTRRISVLPEPTLVFGSLLRKWNEFAPAKLMLDPDWHSVLDGYCSLDDVRIQTRRYSLKRRTELGFTGWCHFRALKRDPQFLRLLNTLAAFAMYAGVGYKTTMGMGQAWQFSQRVPALRDRVTRQLVGV